MLDSNDLLGLIKRAALDAEEQAQPCDFLFGTVTNESPLKIRVEQKLELGMPQLVLTRNVSDYSIKIKGENIGRFYYTEDGDKADVAPPHVHAIGEIEVKVRNALKTGENVILLKQRGGQKYLVLDRGGKV